MIGVDEVGRGCWAGPMLVVAARANTKLPKGLKDSKLLSKNQREKILEQLSICCEFGEGWVSANEIDELGLTKAQSLGAHRALERLGVKDDEGIIIDGKINFIPTKYTNVKAMVKADNLVPEVSAASIHAKVTRDKYMAGLAVKYPNYSFENHVGYGTKLHIDALGNFGVIEKVHRLSYAPIAKFAEGGI